MTITMSRASALCAAIVFVVLTIGATITTTARADFGVKAGTFSVTTTTNGSPNLQAGAHSDLTVSFDMATTTTDPTGQYPEIPDQGLKDVDVSLPAGFAGAPTATPQCTEEQLFGASNLAQPTCPAGSWVGMMTLKIGVFGMVLDIPSQIYNMVPTHGHTAEFGAHVLAIPEVTLVVSVDPDGGLTTRIHNASAMFPVFGSSVTLWGIPADSNASSSPRRPLLTNPTSCAPLGPATIKVDSWEHPGDWKTATTDVGPYAGCDKLTFTPKLDVKPVVTQADSPSGYVVDIDVPQNDDPDQVATPQLKDAVVTLPKGVTLSPAVADGLQACTDDQLAAGSTDPAACPSASKIGDVTVTTPALPDQMTGSTFLGQPKADDPYRIFLEMAGDGVRLKLRGSVKADPVTGQLTTTFLDNPQQPFSRLELRFKGGDRAPLTTPATCGTATAIASLTPWSAPDSGDPAAASSSFDISWDGAGAECPATVPFTPSLSAGVTSTTAGASSPFVFRVQRPDRDQTLSTISDVHLPPGLLADVSTVGRCPSAAAATGACPADSQIGQALTGSGPGAHPLYLPGKVYLTEGYKGAPFGLAIVVPAVAGPFDLGTVVVRAAVRVNNDASLTVDADPLPTMLQGIPLRLQDIVLKLDRAGFMQNPTSCDPMAVTATIGSTSGTKAAVTDRFQASDCASLPFRPSVVATTNAGNNNTNGASLHVTVRGRAGDANLRKVEFTLPKNLGPRLSTLNSFCTEAQFAAAQCPAESEMGTARAVTPILPQPLTGPVYLVARDKALPKLMVPLAGNGITITLTGDVSIVGTRTTTTFDSIPDVAISSFDLDLPMGPKSLLTGEGNVCDRSTTAPTVATGQNGRVLSRRTPVRATGCPLHIAKAAVHGTSVRLTITGLQAGKLTVSGAGIRHRSRAVKRAAIAHMAVGLSQAARRKLADAGSMRVRVRATLQPGSGSRASSSRTVTFRR